MGRISEKFQDMRLKGRKGFIVYITAGDPDLDSTGKLVLELERRGVDLVELGVPFSDPVADGPTIQRASERALRNGVKLAEVLGLVGELRRKSELPVLLFSYLNPILSFGPERFVREASAKGVDGVLVLDLPPEEAEDYVRTMWTHNLDTVFLVAPTSTDGRIAKIAALSTGFIYCVSRTGVTGERDKVSPEVRATVERVRRHTELPVAVGFGISKPEHVKEVAEYADAVVVGSAVVRRIEEFAGSPGWISRIGSFVGELVGALR